MQPASEVCRFVVLISGQGTNLREIVRTCRARQVPAEFVKVISNQADAPGLQWAREHGIETDVLSHKDFGTREAFDAALATRIQSCRPDYVILAGFMRILTEGFVRQFENRMVNIHPSLLPACTGLRTHARAIESGVGWHGCTVHFVTPELDHGPIIAQAALEIEQNDTADSLASRVQTLEHRLYPQVVEWLAQGRISLDQHNTVHVRGVAHRHIKGYQA